jgi:hypothetical protein
VILHRHARQGLPNRQQFCKSPLPSTPTCVAAAPSRTPSPPRAWPRLVFPPPPTLIPKRAAPWSKLHRRLSVRRSKLCHRPSVHRSKLCRRLAPLLFVSRACSSWVKVAAHRRIAPLRATVVGRGRGRWPTGGEEAEVGGGRRRTGFPVSFPFSLLCSAAHCCA